MKFEDRSLKLDLCALALAGARRVPRRRAVDVQSDRSAQHDRLAAEPNGCKCLRPGRRATPPTTCSKASASARTTWLASLAVLTFLLLVRREIDQPMLRAVRLGDLGRRPHDARRAGDSELDARPGRRRRRLHRRDGPQLVGNVTSPKPARTSSRSACCWPACCCRPITSCSAPRR